MPNDPNVDAELLAGLEMVPPFVLNDESLPLIREATAQMLPPPDSYTRPDIAMEEHRCAGLNGAPDVRFFVYSPIQRKGPLPLFLFFHGGGYVFGSVEGNHPSCVVTADDVGCVVASIDYRLAPETRAPGQVEDGYAVLAHLHDHADAFGIDVSRIAVGGESAGGGLAAALALMVRDKAEFDLCFQQLIYPMIDDRTCTRADIPDHVGQHIWTQSANQFGWQALLGTSPGGDDVTPYAAAARATNLVGLPPAYISVGDLDLFLDEDMDYARRLMAAGLAVELHVLPGAYHGYELNRTAGVTIRSETERRQALGRAFDPITD